MKAKQAKAAIPYARRVAEDKYVQEQLHNAVTRLGDAYARISRQKADAAEDKKLYASLRGAAVSIRKALGAIEEPPPRRKRRGRKALLLGLAVPALVLIAKRERHGESDASDDLGTYDGSEEPAVQPAPQASPAETAA
jgi:hypothetical protein